MADITLSTGQEITFDLNKMTRREMVQLLSTEQTEEEGHAIIAKTCDLTGEEISNLGFEDWRRLMRAFWKKSARPLDDPND